MALSQYGMARTNTRSRNAAAAAIPEARSFFISVVPARLAEGPDQVLSPVEHSSGAELRQPLELRVGGVSEKDREDRDVRVQPQLPHVTLHFRIAPPLV